MKDSMLKNFLVNVRALFSTNIRRRLNDDSNRIAKMAEALDGLDDVFTTKFHYLNLMDYYAIHKDEADTYRKELDYLQQLGHYVNFPYKSDPGTDTIESGMDEATKLPFVIHKGKKLFFPSHYSLKDAIATYLRYIQEEKLLGVDETEESPHQYQSPWVCVEEGDVVFDVGAAEGLFALDQIDKASHVVVVERDPVWREPLRQTFAPYGDKVTIIEKFISAVDTENTMSLQKLLKDMDYASAFVKMDVEGSELPSLTGALEVLKGKWGTKLSVASYHRQHDAEQLKALFDGIGYTSQFSNGYMLFSAYDTPAPPYFRRGIIRAKTIGI